MGTYFSPSSNQHNILVSWLKHNGDDEYNISNDVPAIALLESFIDTDLVI
jgi:hypothetical protein